MAKPTDQRVNKNLVIPGDQPLIDPGASDVPADHSYDTIEAIRVERGLAAAEQQGREAPQAQTGEDAAIAGAVDADAVEAAREARFEDLENIHEAGAISPTDVTPENTTEPMNYP